jgi:ABC-2 type transport system permease protein
MSNLAQACWVELLKARRSRAPWVTALVFTLFPLVGGFFMIVIRDPEMARTLGLISVKAQIVAGSVDWPAYLSFLAMATTIAGFILFGLICTWVFGREYADHTIKDLLALPTPRSAIVLAKFLLFILWSFVLLAISYLVGLGVGAAIALPPVPAAVFWQGGLTMAVAAGMSILLSCRWPWLPALARLLHGRALIPRWRCHRSSRGMASISPGRFCLYIGMVGPELYLEGSAASVTAPA